jgi:NAD(P)-dependent dehydrogenase (short-subunit alcohol dehydrogenase family)
MSDQAPVAIITGAAQGIGLATAKRFAEDGYRVAIVDLSREKAEQEADQLRNAGTAASAYKADVSDSAAVNETVAAVVNDFGRVDVLVNNAGTHVPGNVVDTTDDVYNRVVDSIMKGTFYFSRAVLPTMISQGSGAIVNVASVWAWDCAPGAAPYCMAKAGVVAFTKSLASEGARHGIRVNAVGPYLIATELHRASHSDEARREMAEGHPMGREGEPNEVAAAIAFLASDQASWVSGDTLTTSGGALLR